MGRRAWGGGSGILNQKVQVHSKAIDVDDTLHALSRSLSLSKYIYIYIYVHMHR